MSLARRSGWLRSGLVLGGVLAALSQAGLAHASDSTDQCLAAYEAGQRLRQSGDLVSAADELLVCGGPACPVRMQGDCQRWRDDVERATPAVVFRVRGAKGELLANVNVSIDGGDARRLDGRALLMNPGEHVIVFDRPGYQPLSTPVFVTEGEKLEPRVVRLVPLVNTRRSLDVPLSDEGEGEGDVVMGEPSNAPELSHPSSRWPLALGAVGLAGAAGFVYFGVRAQGGETDLEQCTPNCTRAQVDDVKQDYLYSNVSLGIGLAGLVGAGLWLLLDEGPANGTAAGAPRHGLQLGTTTRWVTRF